MRRWLGVPAVLVCTAMSLALLVPGESHGVPRGVSASPRFAPSGAEVVVSGGGCSGAVHLTAQSFLFPGAPTIAFDAVVSPSEAGDWTYRTVMPPAPTVVMANCDGADAAPPLAIAPSDVAVGDMAVSDVTASTVAISTSPLVDGSAFEVFGPGGDLVGSARVVGNAATVLVPRSLGAVQVTAIGVRVHDPGIAMPFVPIARRVQLPLASAPSVEAVPRVAPPGSSVVVSGSCTGAARLVVKGRPAGWYDIAPTYFDADVAVSGGGLWSTTMSMPPLPSTVTLRCTNGGSTQFAEVLISPSTGDLVAVAPEPTGVGGATVVTLPRVMQLDRLAAFTADGRTVPLAIIDPATLKVSVSPGFGPIRVVIIGIETLGENAQALQVTRVQAWTVEAPFVVAGVVPISGLAPATRLSLGR